jgi:two-component system response regulator AtoC
MSAHVSWALSPSMQAVEALVDRVADSDATVLVTGESGVGKEVVARALHERSPRRDRPFVKVNCAAMPVDLLESEMFGHERGAFTGAMTATAGKFEAADRGTLLLDEIGELPAVLQAKLLHVLEDGRFCKLGSNDERDVDVRVIAATNRPIAPMIADGSFREDLYYRLQVIEIHVPPLRERPEEILPLAAALLAESARREGVQAPVLTDALTDALLAHTWPGNVRELENVVQRFVLLRDETLTIAELVNGRHAPTESDESSFATAASEAAVEPPVEPATAWDVPRISAAEIDAAVDAPGLAVALPELVRRVTERVEKEVIGRVLDLVRWNRRHAARRLGVSYKTLLNKMKALDIQGKSSEDEEPART